MVSKSCVLLCLLNYLVFPTCLLSAPHVSSFPYLAPDTFRQFCTFVLDEDASFDPALVQKGDFVYVKPEFFEQFFSTYHPYITCCYILILQDSDLDTPGAYKKYLDDEKIFMWFARNMDCFHPKLQPIPIGLVNQISPYGDIEIISQVIQQLEHGNIPNKLLLYLNFGISHVSHDERRHVFALFESAPFCTVVRPDAQGLNAAIPLHQYLHDLAHHKFVLSPRGIGVDCYRTWEAMLVGCIPIVKSSVLDVLYEDLPVLIVNDWHEVTENFLNKTYELMSTKTYNLEKLYAPYWLDRIARYQEQLRNS